MEKRCNSCGETKALEQFAKGPCMHGRQAHCKPCYSIRRKRWSSSAPEKNVERRRRWLSANKARHVENSRAWRSKNRDQDNERCRLWREQNPEKAAVQWRKRRARKRGADGTHSVDDIARIIKQQRGKCAYCRCGLKEGITHIDHIMALSNGGSNRPSNLQALCKSCNLRKHTKDPIVFAREFGLLM